MIESNVLSNIGAEGSMLDAFRLKRDSMDGRDDDYFGTVFADADVASMRAKSMKGEWEAFIVEPVKAERLPGGRCAVLDRLYTLDETTAEDEIKASAVAKLSKAEREALGLQPASRAASHGANKGDVMVLNTNGEKSLLLYFESQAVECGGTLERARMNTAEMAIAKRWNDAGFIQFGRIALNDIRRTSGIARDHWVVLSEEAWRLAHVERRARSKRLLDSLKSERIGLPTA